MRTRLRNAGDFTYHEPGPAPGPSAPVDNNVLWITGPGRRRGGRKERPPPSGEGRREYTVDPTRCPAPAPEIPTARSRRAAAEIPTEPPSLAQAVMVLPMLGGSVAMAMMMGQAAAAPSPIGRWPVRHLLAGHVATSFVPRSPKAEMMAAGANTCGTGRPAQTRTGNRRRAAVGLFIGIPNPGGCGRPRAATGWERRTTDRTSRGPAGGRPADAGHSAGARRSPAARGPRTDDRGALRRSWTRTRGARPAGGASLRASPGCSCRTSGRRPRADPAMLILWRCSTAVRPDHRGRCRPGRRSMWEWSSGCRTTCIRPGGRARQVRWLPAPAKTWNSCSRT